MLKKGSTRKVNMSIDIMMEGGKMANMKGQDDGCM